MTHRFAKLISWCAVSILSASLVGDAIAAPARASGPAKAGGHAPASDAGDHKSGPHAKPAKPTGKSGPGKKGPGKKGSGKKGSGKGHAKPTKKPHKPIGPAIAYVARVVGQVSKASAKDESAKQWFTNVCIAEELLEQDLREHKEQAGGKGGSDKAAPKQGGKKAKAPQKGPKKGGAPIKPPMLGHKIKLCEAAKKDGSVTEEKVQEVYKTVTDGVTGLTTGKRGVALAYAKQACDAIVKAAPAETEEAPEGEDKAKPAPSGKAPGGKAPGGKAPGGKVSGKKFTCDFPEKLKAEVKADVEKLATKLAEGAKQVDQVEVTKEDAKTAATDAEAETKAAESTDTAAAAEEAAAPATADPAASEESTDEEEGDEA